MDGQHPRPVPVISPPEDSVGDRAGVQPPPPITAHLDGPSQPAPVGRQTDQVSGLDLPSGNLDGLGNISLPDFVDQQLVPSVSADLGIGVAQNIRDKIVQGQFVELSSLLPNTNPQSVNGAKLIVNPDGHLSMAPPNNKKITTIEEWSDAFLIFLSVYLSGHPQETQGLLKYFSIIRTAAKRHLGLGWLSYDTQFRLRLAASPSARSYGVIDQELWLLCMGPSTAYGFSGDRKCYDFNLRVCTRIACSFRHACLNCNGSHPSSLCWRAATPSSIYRGPRPGRSNPGYTRQPAPRATFRQTFTPRFHTYRPKF